MSETCIEIVETLRYDAPLIDLSRRDQWPDGTPPGYSLFGVLLMTDDGRWFVMAALMDLSYLLCPDDYAAAARLTWEHGNVMSGPIVGMLLQNAKCRMDWSKHIKRPQPARFRLRWWPR